jgi:glycosyltransferase involved in cell wall biosynthesis
MTIDRNLDNRRLVRADTEGKPLVSLCIATSIGRADLFKITFASALKQTYTPLEILVLADGSDPEAIGLLALSKDPRLRWISTPALSGMVPAWNLVCSKAKGKYILFCADDDVLCDYALDQQVELLEGHPNVGFCHADFIVIDDEGREEDRHISLRGRFIDDRLPAWCDYLVATRCCMQTVVFRRDLWQKVGQWDADSGNPADNSLYLKLLRTADVAHVPHIACMYRLRRNPPDSWEKRFRNAREHLALAERHLASPPVGVERVGRVRRRLMGRMLLDSVALSASAPDSYSRQELGKWLEGRVWQFGAFGRVCKLAHRYGWSSAILMTTQFLSFVLRIPKPAIIAMKGFLTSQLKMGVLPCEPDQTSGRGQ